jgi:hypothetical protein
LLDERPFHSAYSIAEALGLSHSTILTDLRESLGMKKFSITLDPGRVTTSLRQVRMEICQELLHILKACDKDKVERFVTWDESRFTLEFHHCTKWSVSRDDIPQKVKQQIGIQKFMLTVI